VGRELFREEVSSLIHETLYNQSLRQGKRSKAFAELERSIRAAWVATHHLTKWERTHLEIGMQERWRSMARPNSRAGRAISLMMMTEALGWRHPLSFMVSECARLTGKNPYPAGRARLRRRGDIKDYPLRSLVTDLAATLMDTGGHLTLDVKG